MTEQSEIVPGVARPPRREDYEPIVRGLRPFVGEEELMLRSSLLLMRDRAMSAKQSGQLSEPAWRVLDVVERLTSENAMNNRMGVVPLRELRRLCLNCVASASSLDTLFRLQPEPPEAA